jgi:hypothetical protein
LFNNGCTGRVAAQTIVARHVDIPDDKERYSMEAKHVQLPREAHRVASGVPSLSCTQPQFCSPKIDECSFLGFDFGKYELLGPLAYAQSLSLVTPTQVTGNLDT